MFMENYVGLRGSLVIVLVCLQHLLRSIDNTGNKFPRATFLATLLRNMEREREIVFVFVFLQPARATIRLELFTVFNLQQQIIVAQQVTNACGKPSSIALQCCSRKVARICCPYYCTLSCKCHFVCLQWKNVLSRI